MEDLLFRELLPRFVQRVRERKEQVLPRHQGVLFEIRLTLGRKQYSLAETDESRPGRSSTNMPKPVSVSVR